MKQTGMAIPHCTTQQPAIEGVANISMTSGKKRREMPEKVLMTTNFLNC